VAVIRKRLEEELKKEKVELNEEKTRIVNVSEGGSFEFLGFDLREAKNGVGKKFILRTPMKKKQSELLRQVGRILSFPGIASFPKSWSGFVPSSWGGSITFGIMCLTKQAEKLAFLYYLCGISAAWCNATDYLQLCEHGKRHVQPYVPELHTRSYLDLC